MIDLRQTTSFSWLVVILAPYLINISLKILLLPPFPGDVPACSIPSSSLKFVQRLFFSPFSARLSFVRVDVWNFLTIFLPMFLIVRPLCPDEAIAGSRATVKAGTKSATCQPLILLRYKKILLISIELGGNLFKLILSVIFSPKNNHFFTGIPWPAGLVTRRLLYDYYLLFVMITCKKRWVQN